MKKLLLSITFTLIILTAFNQNPLKQFDFITREIENNSGKWIARIIIEKVSNAEFIESFDIAMDGENYVQFLKNTWRKTE